ncbi:MAG: ATP-binding protein [Bulleidia sp.]
MLKRRIYSELLRWKNKENRKSLLVKGPRQVGKTYIIRAFGTNEYANYIEINFLEHPEFKAIFDGPLSADTIYANMSLYDPEWHFQRGNTLVFLDEIQECPNARAALKFLTIDGRFDVIASGSLLGISFKDVPSIPVGYETQMYMYPLDFEEYLWAKGYTDKHFDLLRNAFNTREKINPAVNDTFLHLVREYIAVGGMPEVVNTFLASNNYRDVYEMQNMILNSYYDDISKYAEPFEKPKIKKCYLSLPAQLAKENRKFQYSTVEKGSSARKFGNSIEWLKNAGLIYACTNVATPSFPLIAYENSDYFKAYMSDVGLLTALYGFDLKQSIITNTLSGPMKGGLYENFVAIQLISKDNRLHYFKAQNGDVEIEFLLEREGNIIPVEVKAGNSSSKSLNIVLKRDDIPFGYKLISGNTGIADKKISLPLYMSMFL